MNKFDFSEGAMDTLILLVGNALQSEKAKIYLARDLVRELGYKSCSNKDVEEWLDELFPALVQMRVGADEVFYDKQA